MKETLKLESILPLIRETVDAGASFRFFPRGKSMLPMLREGMDSVELVSKNIRVPKKGDAVLYSRPNGTYVLHRIVRAERDGSFTMCGDNQVWLEKNVRYDSIIAVLGGFWREEKYVSADDAEYNEYVRKRIRSRGMRHLRSWLSRHFC